ncbi:hypothetical protein [Cylindrospermopsis sp. CR12]|uniref:hypothetical protein n=2 Tax=Cylindrospermopsis TaxID=77021 RepID=UPI00128F58F1|nr:hypothetical protein [Cylindrospermopsis sp. CR12]
MNKLMKHHFYLTLTLSSILLLVSPVRAVDDLVQDLPPGNINNIAIGVSQQQNILEKFTGLKNAVRSFNRNLKNFVQDKKDTGNLNSRAVLAQINQLKQEISTLSQTPVARSSAILKELERATKYLENGLEPKGVTGIQKYLGFFAKKKVNKKYYGNFGKTTQEEIEKFTNAKIQQLEKEITTIQSLTGKTGTKSVAVLSTNSISNIPSSSTKVDPKSNNPKLNNNEPNNNAKELAALKSRLDRMEKTAIIIGLIFLIGIVVCIYVLSQIIGNPEMIKRLNKLDQSNNNSMKKFKDLETRLGVIGDDQKTLIEKINNLSNLDRFNGEQVSISEPPKLPVDKRYQSQKLPFTPNNLENPIIVLYNNKANALIDRAIPVSEAKLTAYDRRLGRYTQPVLEETRRGNYWVIIEGAMNYLVPKFDIRINSHNYSTISLFFECFKYDHKSINDFKDFRLISPAIVSATGNKWELVERGELEF